MKNHQTNIYYTVRKFPMNIRKCFGRFFLEKGLIYQRTTDRMHLLLNSIWLFWITSHQKKTLLWKMSWRSRDKIHTIIRSYMENFVYCSVLFLENKVLLLKNCKDVCSKHRSLLKKFTEKFHKCSGALVPKTKNNSWINYKSV